MYLLVEKLFVNSAKNNKLKLKLKLKLHFTLPNFTLL